MKDPSIQTALNMSMQNSQTSLADLKQCVQQADPVFKPTMVAYIASLEDGQMQTLHSWMDTAAESIAKGELYPLPGETVSFSIIIDVSFYLNFRLNLSALLLEVQAEPLIEFLINCLTTWQI